MNIINFNGAFTLGETGNWIANIISWLVNGTSVAVGIILFTLILKAITLPFDIMSRISMRKNSLKMEEMRPELERLQKQYAGDKALYNQKMMALYKKNGYSMWGACLPTVLTLIIFIIAINGFTTYSQYKNREYFYEMTNAYNNVVYAGFDVDGTYITRNEEGKLIIDDKALIKLAHENSLTEPTEITFTDSGVKATIKIDEENRYFTIKTKNGYAEYKRYYAGEASEPTIVGDAYFTLIEDKLNNTADENGNYTNPLASKDNNYLLTDTGKGYLESNMTAAGFITELQRTRSAEQFRQTKASFLWVKNIWVSDSPFYHPISDDVQNVNAKSSCDCKSEKAEYLSQDNYNELTYKLDTEKTAPNGYFILVILTAATSLLMQIITNKSQKAQMELQTVDGQGAQTQKMMTWFMPIMMAVFAFIYTAAFSIYIILSSAISAGTTLLTNFLVGKKFDQVKAIKDAKPVRGRIYVKKEEPKEKEKAAKKDEIKRVDFLNSEKENKRIRRGK